MSGLRATLLLSAAPLLSTCSESVAPPRGEPITELPRELTSLEASIIERSNAFGIELVREVVTRDARPNVVLSPLSASMALGMALNGAEAATFDAMRTALGFDGLERSQINESYRGLIDLLTQLDPEVRFQIANAIWANRDVPFHQAFFDAVGEAFDARAESSDFADPATLSAVNEWVSDHTEGRIEQILEQLDPDLAMLLINAIYFDASWTTAFDPSDTRKQAFTRADGSSVQVDMMTMDGVELPLGSGSGYSAVELPYGGGAFSMVVVVPHEADGARGLLEQLDGEGWDEIVDGLSPVEVDLVAIPRFTLTYDAFLNEALKAMGMGTAFRPGADFTRMSPAGDQLCIDFVRQKTFIEVDEAGTRAAAVTAVGIGVTSFLGLVADRPFVLAIRERLSGTILFIGLVGDPLAEDPGPEPYATECG